VVHKLHDYRRVMSGLLLRCGRVLGGGLRGFFRVLQKSEHQKDSSRRMIAK
jgi:hypothetical protein